MSQMSRSCMVSRPSSKSGESGVGKELVSVMRQRCNGISAANLDMSISQDRGLGTLFETVRRLLITLSLMDYSFSPDEGLSQSSKSNTTTVRTPISNLWTSTFRWLRHSLEKISGSFRSSRSSNGTTKTPIIPPVSGCATISRIAELARSESISADPTGVNE